MDKRNRPALRRNRAKKEYKTVSAMISRGVYDVLNDAIIHEQDRNMSQFIEDNISIPLICTCERRKYGDKSTVKKTFSFTKKYAESLKKTGNISVVLDNLLKEFFNK